MLQRPRQAVVDRELKEPDNTKEYTALLALGGLAVMMRRRR